MVTPPRHWLECQRTVRFGETDAAGVMHFHHLLRWCHEAYEESLEAFGVPTAAVFANRDAAFPIIHCEADYRQPLRCGDRLVIHLKPRMDSAETGVFSVGNTFTRNGEVVATASTQHVCIHRYPERRRQPLFDSNDPNNPATKPIYDWLMASDPALAATGDAGSRP